MMRVALRLSLVMGCKRLLPASYLSGVSTDFPLAYWPKFIFCCTGDCPIVRVAEYSRDAFLCLMFRVCVCVVMLVYGGYSADIGQANGITGKYG